MELCVNYTAEVKELFEEGKIDFVDYFKLYSINGDLSPIEWCIQNKKLIFHGLVGHGANTASKAFLQNRDFTLQKDYYQRGRCPHISFHINLEREEPIESEEETIKTIQKNIQEIRKIFDDDILLENVPARREDRKRDFIAKPEFISKVIQETDTYFLFDTSHARSAAYTLGIPFMEYVNALPLDRLREVHLSGCVKAEDGRIVPNHSEMNEEDYELLDDLLERCHDIRVLTLEYGPYDIHTHDMIPTYDKVDQQMKQAVYENLLRLNEVMRRRKNG